MVGADAARPSSKTRFALAVCFSRRSRATFLVRMSAGFSAPATFSSVKSLERNRSWTQRSDTAKCRTLPSPRLRQMPIAAAASEKISMDQINPRSAATACIPNEWLAPLHTPTNSASAELKVTVDWVLDQWRIRCPPCIIIPPEVERRVTTQPAKSVSTNVVRVPVGCCHRYFHTSQGLCTKYLTRRLSFSRDFRVGRENSRHNSFVA